MPSVKKEEMDLERSVCGALREPLAFWLFRRAAGAPDAARVASLRDLERLAFTTRDGRRLGGYKLRAAKPQGYLLVAPGNAMLADQIVGELQVFRDLGLDIYVYDYRGYGLSQGKSRLAALISARGYSLAERPGLPPPFSVWSVDGRHHPAECGARKWPIPWRDH